MTSITTGQASWGEGEESAASSSQKHLQASFTPTCVSPVPPLFLSFREHLAQRLAAARALGGTETGVGRLCPPHPHPSLNFVLIRVVVLFVLNASNHHLQENPHWWNVDDFYLCGPTDDLS